MLKGSLHLKQLCPKYGCLIFSISVCIGGRRVGGEGFQLALWASGMLRTAILLVELSWEAHTQCGNSERPGL